MARDIFHPLVREALEADGWRITHDPLYMRTGGVEINIDLAAERVLAAEKGDEKIAVEIKSFIGKSKINDFYEAKGQYDVYRQALTNEGSPRHLFLAVEEDIYKTFFQRPLIRQLIENDRISLLVFSPKNKKIVLWKK